MTGKCENCGKALTKRQRRFCCRQCAGRVAGSSERRSIQIGWHQPFPGRLRVLGFAKFRAIGSRGNRQRFWKCKCDCGGTRIVSTANLNQLRVKSCGCLKREKDGERGRALTMEQRSERSKKAWASLAPEQKVARMEYMTSCLSAQQRSQAARKRLANMGPERMLAITKKMSAGLMRWRQERPFLQAIAFQSLLGAAL
jgi:hypothetical protein